MIIDQYRILEPYGRDLTPEAHWLESFGADVDVWLAWKLTDGEEIGVLRPLTAEERATAVAFLKSAKRTAGCLDVVLQQATLPGDPPFRSTALENVAELQLVVTK